MVSINAGCSLFTVDFSGPQINGPPANASTAQLDKWWSEMQACRTAQLASVNYTAPAFADPGQHWTQSAFAIPMTQGYDRFLYDEVRGVYTVDRYVDDAQTRYGGVDAIFLWPTYTNIGLDNRNQLDLFRSMPGGLAALRNVTRAFHARGVHVMWGYNPWDTGTEREPGWLSVDASDPTDVTDTAVAGQADGFNMDTMKSTPRGFYDEALAKNASVAYQPEGGGALQSMDWETMSTCHCN